MCLEELKKLEVAVLKLELGQILVLSVPDDCFSHEDFHDDMVSFSQWLPAGVKVWVLPKSMELSIVDARDGKRPNHPHEPIIKLTN